jgi:membrane fusion protein, multidrug efflux system
MNWTGRVRRPLAVALFTVGAVGTSPLAADTPLLSVSVTHPLTKHITTWDEYSGRFVAVKSVEVRPRVSGFIDKVNFIDGATVKADDSLFIDDDAEHGPGVRLQKGKPAGKRK